MHWQSYQAYLSGPHALAWTFTPVNRLYVTATRLTASSSVGNCITTRMMLRYRHRLVQMRTKCKNSLQALAFSAGAAKRATLFSHKGRERLLQLPMSAAMARQRREWLAFVAQFDERIHELDGWLGEQAKLDERVLRLQTHPGIGLLTSLALVHGLEPVSRFAGGRKVAAYVELEPVEHSSGGKQKFGSIITVIALPAGGGGANSSETG